jgi:hypothetical protein
MINVGRFPLSVTLAHWDWTFMILAVTEGL